jgi:hypothetical protein
MPLRFFKAVRAEKGFPIVMRLLMGSWARGLKGWSRKQREMSVGASIGTMDDDNIMIFMTAEKLFSVLNVLLLSICEYY